MDSLAAGYEEFTHHLSDVCGSRIAANQEAIPAADDATLHG